ncbi:TerC family protein [Marinicella litoralis]|uniref:Putative tellurium resistance membrane protein TerC n=1 Tax=Marinicella litoralis TaxID=644220 RepID=A0A4R6XBX4_9GAMM|nr:TerC family protein [Marinicella litoralis]TDR16765.1 putative tellurium resistance membrane protein TerC [Marinicella litoralis]
MEALITLFADPHTWLALATLILMEVILGIDNLIFISILTNKLPKEKQANTRKIGIILALVLRLGLLATIAFIVSLTQPLFELFDHPFSWRDLIMLAGGLFLVWKATKEIRYMVDPDKINKADSLSSQVTQGVGAVMAQIIVLDLVFSIDSIITAVGMTDHLPIMVVAVVVAVLVMLLAAEPLSKFIDNNPTIVMLALGFLLVIGTTLIAEGFSIHFPKQYIYAAMAFSVFIETLNMLAKRAKKKANDA